MLWEELAAKTNALHGDDYWFGLIILIKLREPKLEYSTVCNMEDYISMDNAGKPVLIGILPNSLYTEF